jgi:uridylate kinase
VTSSVYHRVVLKLSGESLEGERESGLSPAELERLAGELAEVQRRGVQLAVVVGGGNIFRGLSETARRMDRVIADHMGMLATVINALALGDALRKQDVSVRVMSARPVPGVVEDYDRQVAVRHLDAERVVILAAGTGNPFFTTDTAAVLRALELGADAVLKATRVDGVFSADPELDPAAVKYDRLTYNEAIERELRVMDLTAFTLAREGRLPVVVFDLGPAGAIARAAAGQSSGTLIQGSE